ADLNLRYGAEICPDLVHDFKEEWYGERLDDLTPVQAVADFARNLHGEGKKISVASGSHMSLVIPSLKQIDLNIFDIVITPADVERGKPFPDMFLLAAEKMGVAPEDCLVFEDGQAGIDAADAAGMESVFVDSRRAECGDRNADCGSA
ncbi:MAG: HAD family phosphatase, partial [Methylococcales bacterium]|nr:HAD family phosphatase [Methylococcales bacterium]